MNYNVPKIWTIFSLSVLIKRVLITKKVCIMSFPLRYSLVPHSTLGSLTSPSLLDVLASHLRNFLHALQRLKDVLYCPGKGSGRRYEAAWYVSRHECETSCVGYVIGLCYTSYVCAVLSAVIRCVGYVLGGMRFVWDTSCVWNTWCDGYVLLTNEILVVLVIIFFTTWNETCFLWLAIPLLHQTSSHWSLTFAGKFWKSSWLPPGPWGGEGK